MLSFSAIARFYGMRLHKRICWREQENSLWSRDTAAPFCSNYGAAWSGISAIGAAARRIRGIHLLIVRLTRHFSEWGPTDLLGVRHAILYCCCNGYHNNTFFLEPGSNCKGNIERQQGTVQVWCCKVWMPINLWPYRPSETSQFKTLNHSSWELTWFEVYSVSSFWPLLDRNNTIHSFTCIIVENLPFHCFRRITSFNEQTIWRVLNILVWSNGISLLISQKRPSHGKRSPDVAVKESWPTSNRCNCTKGRTCI